MKRSALGGLFLAFMGIAVGLYLDGGKLSQLVQPTAALIVFGGTLGAVIVQFPFSVLLQATGYLKSVFFGEPDPTPELIEDLLRYAMLSRRNGIVSLDAELDIVADPFLRKCLTLAVDGTHAAEIRQTMELAMDIEADEENSIPRVFEAAGGFAPTIGILGAVIGLIQVMQHLENISEVGKGIAAAFVATIYGVGIANLFLLPCAGRVKRLIRKHQTRREMMLEGVLEIVEKSGPAALEAKLMAYMHEPVRKRRITLAGR